MCQLVDSMSLLEKMLVGWSQKRVSLTVETVVINDALQFFEPHVEFQMYYRWFSDLWVEQLIKPWAVRTVIGSVRVYLQLSNLEFCVQLQKGRWKNNMWLTNERDPVLFEPSARAPFRFWCVPLSVLAYRQESMVLLRLWQIAGGSTMQNFSVHPVWSVLPLRREWFAVPRVGFLSNFQQFLLWLYAPHWCKLLLKYPPRASEVEGFRITSSNKVRLCLPKGAEAEFNYSWSHRPKLIYLLHLASINSFKSQVTSLFNTSTKV